MSVVEVKDLSVRFGELAVLDNLSFSILEKSITVIIGPNGAGKSVLLKTILGLIEPTGGSVKLLGEDPRNHRLMVGKIGYVPQRLHYDHSVPLTVDEILRAKCSHVPFWLRARRKQRDNDHISQTLKRVGAESLRDKGIGVLSGGQLQRVLIASALLSDPPLLVLDEAAAGIDITGAETFYSLLKRLRDEDGKTILLVTHDLDMVYAYADTVLCLNSKLLCDGVPHKVLTDEKIAESYGPFVAHYHHKGDRHHDI